MPSDDDDPCTPAVTPLVLQTRASSTYGLGFSTSTAQDTTPTGVATEADGPLPHLRPLLRKAWTQYRRSRVLVAVEVLLPLLFVACLMWLRSLSDDTIVPATQFVRPNDDLSPTTQLGAFAEFFCATPTEGLPDQPRPTPAQAGAPSLTPAASGVLIGALQNISGRAGDGTVPDRLCAADESPTCVVHDADTGLSLCLRDSQRMAAAIAAPRPWLVPPLDVMRAMQQIARSDALPALASQLNYFRALQHSGWLYFAPDTADTHTLVAHLNRTVATFGDFFGGVVGLESIIGRLNGDAAASETWGVVEVRSLNQANGSDVMVHLRRAAVPLTARLTAPFSQGLGDYSSRVYLMSGFLSIQAAVAEYYVREVLPAQEHPFTLGAATIVPMPFGQYTESNFNALAPSLAPLALVFGVLFGISQMTKRLVEEKESRARELMMILGLDTASFYLSGFVLHGGIALCSGALVALALWATVLPQASPTLLLALCCAFGLASVSFSFLLSAFFSKARLAALIAPVAFFVLCVPAFAVTGAGWRLCLLAPSAFAIGSGLFFSYEVSGGLTWAHALSSSDSVPLAAVLTLLLFDAALYTVLGVYLDLVLPRDWGTPRHPLFFLRAKRAPLPARADGRNPDGVFESRKPGSTLLPQPSAQWSTPTLAGQSSTAWSGAWCPEPTVTLRGLRREFDTSDGGRAVAVRDLTLDFYENEVTVLLGHNGAGKTTAINCMTGMLGVTAGDCVVYGHSVCEDLQAARREIGVCPQHNVLWEGLTCREHLQFFAALKGVPLATRAVTVSDMLTAVDLADKADTFASGLSGGQKRKLSVAIAFIGGSRLVFLDEPTAGMDVAARRFTWDLIKRMSPGRTIILTTHFMDEADLLGNTVAIVAKGRLQCCGSPVFLKSRLGIGYTLTVALDTSTAPDLTARHNVINHVLRSIPDADVLTDAGAEVSLRLPMTTTSRFPRLLSTLEGESGRDLGVQSYGISVTTLEEVFLRIGAMADGDAEPPTPTPRTPTRQVTLLSQSEVPRHPDVELSLPVSVSLERTVGQASWRAQFHATVVKRARYASRDRRTQVIQLVLPVLGICLAMLFSLVDLTATPAMTMSPAQYSGGAIETVIAGCPLGFETQLPQPTSAVVLPTATPFNLSDYLLLTVSRHPRNRPYGLLCDDRVVTSNRTNRTVRDVVLFTNDTKFPHSAPLALNAWYNAAAQDWFHGSRPLVIGSHPLPMSEEATLYVSSVKTFMIAVFIMIPFTFIPSTYVGFIVKERECKARHLQDVAGMDHVVYWVSNLCFDSLSFVATAVLALGVFAVFGRVEYIGDINTTLATLTLFSLYGLSGVTGSYVVSFLFNDHVAAQNAVMMGNFVCGFLLVLTAYMMEYIDSTAAASRAVTAVSRVNPAFCLGNGIIAMALRHANMILYPWADQNPWSFRFNGWNYLALALEGPIFFFVVLAIDHPSLRPWVREAVQGKWSAAPEASPRSDIDPDVAAEERAVLSGEVENAAVVVEHLTRSYGENTAVDDLTFAVRKGEVLGFLGTNGAGKTTTMSVLCGELLPSSGRALVAGVDVVSNPRAARRCIGYCPQFDALLDRLTVQEHLELYGCLRAVARARMGVVLQQLLTLCDLTAYRDTQAQSLSGGNKRKLSVAIALIGEPQVLFLDEPSAGMDPAARRALWSVLEVAAPSTSIVLTTHHLEEVEALATRVGIMSRGRLRCLGSLQHLKSTFGAGFDLAFRVRTQRKEAGLRKFVGDHFPQAVLQEARDRKLSFTLPSETCLSGVFSLVESKRAELGIVDYCISQLSLESVFLKIAQHS